MTILLNLSNDYKININKEIEIFDLVLSPFECLEFKNNQTFKKLIFFDSIFSQSMLMNQYFWIMNMQQDYYFPEKKISKIIIYHGENERFSKFKKEEDIVLKKLEDITFKNLYLIIDDNTKYTRVPTHYYYNKNVLYTTNDYIEVWLLFLLLKFKGIQIKEHYTDDKIIKFSEKIIENKEFINGGNEGILLWSENFTKIKKLISLNQVKNDNQIKLYKDNNVKFCLKDISIFYEDSQLKIDVFNDWEKYCFTYENIVLPTSKLDFVRLARLLIRQWETSIFIDDNKLINYGKIRFIDTPFFEIIYNDLGSSFIKTESIDFRNGLIRDVYNLVKNQKKINHRLIIQSKRKIHFEQLLKDDLKFKHFYDFIIEKYQEMPMICHDLEVYSNIKKYDIVYTCNNISTMNRLIKLKNNKKFVYEMKNNKVYECKNYNFELNGFKLNGFEKELSANLEIIDGAKKWIRK